MLHKFYLHILCMLMFGLSLNAQTFQYHYGTGLNNTFSKVIQHGTNYYVLGSEDFPPGSLRRATIAYLDAFGNIIWVTNLDIPSQWNDGVLTPGGDLMVAGNTLTQNNTEEGLIGKILTNGSFSWVKSYADAGPEFYTCIERNPNPQSNLYPYYVLGKQQVGGPSNDDAVLINLDEFGTPNWKYIYNSAGDDDFMYDMEALSNGELIIAGGTPGVWGVLLRIDNAGTFFGGATPSGESLTYTDIAQTTSGSGDLYSIANSNTSQATYVFKHEPTYLWLLWEYELTGLTEVSQIFELFPGEFCITGKGLFNNKTRTVLLRFSDLGSSIAFQWLKFLDNGETVYDNGFASLVSANRIAFSDGRAPIFSGLGGIDAFLSISDLNLNTCMTKSNSISETPIAFLYDSPALIFQASVMLPPETNVLWSHPIWLRDDACASTICNAAFSFSLLDPCGKVQLIDQSTAGSTITNYCWDFNNSLGSCESTLQNPVFQNQMPACLPFNACLIITTLSGCKDTLCQVINATDVVPPAITCPPDLTLGCNDNLSPSNTGSATAIDNCSGNPLITFSNVVFANNPCNGFIQRIWKATDNCGNTSTCIQSIMMIDNVPPLLLNCPADMTVSSFGVPTPCTATPIISSPQGFDLCDQNVMVKNSFNQTNNASGTYPEGTTTVTWTATDDCGNSSTCAFTVTVVCDSFPDFDCGLSLVTNHSQIDPALSDGYVLSLVDSRNITNSLMLQNLSPPVYHHPDWTQSKLGEVFGIATDKSRNVYVTATKIYTGNQSFSAIGLGGHGGIYQISAATGSVSTFVMTNPNPAANTVGTNLIPNSPSSPSGLGNICYDESHDQFFVTNFEDGRIYRIAAPGHPLNIPGEVLSTFDPFNPDDGTAGPACLGERLFGIGIYNNQLYFGRWNQNDGAIIGTNPNEIHSVTIDGVTGDFIGSAGLEIIIPTLNSTIYGPLTSPISDIEFNRHGNILLAEHGFYTDTASTQCEFFPAPNMARVLEYSGSTGSWSLAAQFYIGNDGDHTNSAGGVDYGYSFYDANTNTVYGCDHLVYSTGETLISQTNHHVFGIAAINALGNSPALGTNYAPLASWYVDLDGETTVPDWNALGDLDIIQCACIDSICACGSFWDITGGLGGGMKNCLDTFIIPSGTPFTFNASFGCSGNNCSPTQLVHWSLSGQFIPTVTGVETALPNFSFTIPANAFGPGGIYSLDLYSVCGTDTCHCTFQIEIVTCCQSFNSFSEGVEQSVDILNSNFDCSVIFKLDDLPSCDYISLINWGDGSESVGPFVLNDEVTHTYMDEGDYLISYTAVEENPATGETCFTRAFVDPYTPDCHNTCGCAAWLPVTFKATPSSTGIVLNCTDDVVLSCVNGSTSTITGTYQCTACPPSTQIDWQLSHPTLGIVDVGTVIATPGFTISLPSGYFYAIGVYTLTMTAQCLTGPCPCVITIVVPHPCPPLCPCDILDLMADVNQGFMIATNIGNQCQKCFIPQALTACDQVVWTVLPTGYTVTTTGNQWMCYTFPSSGTYTVSMKVYRRKGLNSLCENFVYGKSITVSCGIAGPYCPRPRIFNPGFGEGANPGILGEGGSSEHWINLSGTPTVDISSTSSDGYVITLKGNRTQSDAIMPDQNICIDKESAILRVILQSVGENGAPNRPPRRGEKAIIRLVRDENYLTSDCVAPNCFEVAIINLQEGLTDSQMIEIPIDLSLFPTDDSCFVNPSLEVRAVVLVTNDHEGELVPDSTSYVQLDLFCLQDSTVATLNPEASLSLDIYPNPTDASVTILYPEILPGQSYIQVLNVDGQVLIKQKADSGKHIQTMNVRQLSQGMYFIQVISGNQVLASGKFVKM